MTSMKLFNRWEIDKIEYRDISVKDYLNLKPTIVPYTGGRHVQTQFWKAKTNLVERLVNKVMVSGHLKEGRVHRRVSGRDTGKKLTSMRKMVLALEAIEKKTGSNPIQVLVRAVENTAPRTETTSFRQGGIIMRKPVDVSPQRRVDLALRLISHGAGQRTFKSKSSLEKALAEEIMAAANRDIKTYSISKKDELERVASSSR